MEGEPIDRAARWSRLAWITLVIGVVPTCAGQLLAPVLGLIALLEIRTSGGRQKGRLVVCAGMAAAVLWIGVGAWALQSEIDQGHATQARIANSGADCRTTMLRLAQAWVEASAADPDAVDGLDPGRVLPWLQPAAEEDIWALWQVEYRNVVILGPGNEHLGTFNLTVHDLADPANYAELMAQLLSPPNE